MYIYKRIRAFFQQRNSSNVPSPERIMFKKPLFNWDPYNGLIIIPT